jgi:hypothetical protein
MNVPDNILEPVGNKKGFFSHVFSSTEEGKAEILNVVQYSLLGVIPIVILNKLIQRFIPDADPDKSSIELLAEVLIQIVVMFVGIILIHRIITYLPTYSEFKYESLTLTNVILAFLILVLSIQTKLGIKVNLLFDRVLELWNGPSIQRDVKNRPATTNRHVPSQGDHLGSSQTDMFPPAPQSMSKPDSPYDYMMKTGATAAPMMEMGPMAANGVLGGSFGSSF